MLATKKDYAILILGAALCVVSLFYVRSLLVPEIPCGFDGQPDAHWQEEFNKLDHEWKMYGYCLESKPLAECKKEWGK